MGKAIIFWSQDDDRIYIRPFAARLAGVSEDFLIRCEEQGLVTSRQKTGGGKGFDRDSLRRINLIHRLHRDLVLDLDSIELVLHLRRQILELNDQLEAIRRESQEKERQLLAEIQAIKEKIIQEGHITPK
jgi:MerR family transcriptional regulator/heat shock protein HspR